MARFIAVFNDGATSDQIAAALTALTSNNGTLIQAWGSYAMLADGDQPAQDAVKTADGVALVSSSAVDQPQSLGLGDDALAFVGAWNVRQSSDYQNAVSEFLGTTVSWGDILPPNGCFVYGGSSAGDGTDSGGGSSTPSGGNGSSNLIASTNGSSGTQAGSPQAGSPSPSGGTATAVALSTPSARALVGTIAVGVVMIDGQAGSAAEFTTSERINCIMAASHAFDALYALAPTGSRLVFSTVVKNVKLDVDPTTVAAPPAAGATITSADYESRESLWRDPALTKLGYSSSGVSGMKALCADVKASNPLGLTPDWGYLLVFTKYNAAWMAYGNNLSDPVYIIVAYPQVIDTSHGGWGLAKVHMVVAHESGHMTGAPDEYASSSCSLGGKFGFSHGPNPNCENGNAAPVNCLMRNNQASVCTATTGHFGWADSNGDGILDPYDPTYVRP